MSAPVPRVLLRNLAKFHEHAGLRLLADCLLNICRSKRQQAGGRAELVTSSVPWLAPLLRSQPGRGNAQSESLEHIGEHDDVLHILGQILGAFQETWLVDRPRVPGGAGLRNPTASETLGFLRDSRGRDLGLLFATASPLLPRPTRLALRSELGLSDVRFALEPRLLVWPAFFLAAKAAEEVEEAVSASETLWADWPRQKRALPDGSGSAWRGRRRGPPQEAWLLAS